MLETLQALGRKGIWEGWGIGEDEELVGRGNGRDGGIGGRGNGRGGGWEMGIEIREQGKWEGRGMYLKCIHTKLYRIT